MGPVPSLLGPPTTFFTRLLFKFADRRQIDNASFPYLSGSIWRLGWSRTTASISCARRYPEALSLAEGHEQGPLRAEAQGVQIIDLLPTVEHLEPSILWGTIPDPHPNGSANHEMSKGIVSAQLPLLDAPGKSQDTGSKTTARRHRPPRKSSPLVVLSVGCRAAECVIRFASSGAPYRSHRPLICARDARPAGYRALWSVLTGKRCEIGPGPFRPIGLAAARQKIQQCPSLAGSACRISTRQKGRRVKCPQYSVPSGRVGCRRGTLCEGSPACGTSACHR